MRSTHLVSIEFYLHNCRKRLYLGDCDIPMFQIEPAGKHTDCKWAEVHPWLHVGHRKHRRCETKKNKWQSQFHQIRR